MAIDSFLGPAGEFDESTLDVAGEAGAAVRGAKGMSDSRSVGGEKSAEVMRSDDIAFPMKGLFEPANAVKNSDDILSIDANGWRVHTTSSDVEVEGISPAATFAAVEGEK